MQKHTKVYLNALEYDTSDFIYCEVCRGRAHDIHHIFPRGMGGSMLMDIIENLMALCRTCHNRFGDKEQFIVYLMDIHFNFLTVKSVKFNKNFKRFET